MIRLLILCALVFTAHNALSQVITPPDTSVKYSFTIGGRGPVVSSSFRAGQMAYDGNKYLYFASEGWLSKVDTATGKVVSEYLNPSIDGKPFSVKSWAYGPSGLSAIIVIDYPITVFTTVLALLDTSMHVVRIETSLGTNLYSITESQYTGDAWVYSSNPMMIYKYNWSSNSITGSITPLRNDAHVDYMQVDENENIYLGYYNYNIQKLDKNGNLVLSFPGNNTDFKVTNNNKLLVIDRFDQKIVSYDTRTAAELSRITLKDHPLIPKFKNPTALAVQSSGTIWVLDIGGYGPINILGGPLIYKIKPDGTWISCYGNTSSGIKPSSLMFCNPDLVTVDSRGWIYTASAANELKIEDLYYGPYNLSFFPVSVFLPDGRLITNLQANPYTRIINMEAGPFKRLYITYWTDPRISTVFEMDSANNVWNDLGLTASDPFDHIFGPGNKFYYVRNYQGYGIAPLVYQYDYVTKQSKTLGRQGNDVANDEVFFPNGLARNSKGEFIITDYIQHKVYSIDSAGENMKVINHYGSRDNEVKAPGCVVVDQYDNMYITEAWNNRVKINDKDGNLIRNIGIPGNPYDFDAPSDIAIDTLRHQLYIADRNHNRIQVYKLNYPLTVLRKSSESPLDKIDYTVSDLEIYPNPMKEALDIRASSGIEKVSFYTIKGQLIQCDEIPDSGPEYQFKLTKQIPSDIYIIRVITGDGIIVRKIFKQ